MELAGQAQDLISKVYEEAKADGDPEVDQFLQLHDQCVRWLGHWEWLIKLWATPEGGAHLNLQQTQMYFEDVNSLQSFASSTFRDLKMQPQQVQPCMDRMLRKQWRLLEEEANCLQIVINQLWPSGTGESPLVDRVLGVCTTFRKGPEMTEKSHRFAKGKETENEEWPSKTTMKEGLMMEEVSPQEKNRPFQRQRQRGRWTRLREGQDE